MSAYTKPLMIALTTTPSISAVGDGHADYPLLPASA